MERKAETTHDRPAHFDGQYLAAIPSACLVLDAALTMVAATDAFLHMTGTTRDGVIGKRFTAVFPEDGTSNQLGAPRNVRASIEKAFTRAEGNLLPVERRLVQRVDDGGGGGVERYFRRSNHPIVSTAGQVNYVIHQMEDVTDFIELDRARDASDQASRAKSQFLASMSHELRTPLNSILGFAQLLARDRREPLSERHGERVSKILKGGEHLLHLLDDILDLSRIEMGTISVSVRPVDVLEVLGDVLDMLAPSARAASVRLEVLPGAVGVPLVSADRTRYTQMLVNLGSNAIKYNRPGGRVSFSAAWEEDDGTVCIRVADTGMGIPSDKQGLLFRPFERAGREFGPIEGVGVGLALTKRLAALMGGNIGFTSEEGVGSEFWVRIPIHERGRRTDSPPPPLAEDAIPSPVANRRS